MDGNGGRYLAVVRIFFYIYFFSFIDKSRTHLIIRAVIMWHLFKIYGSKARGTTQGGGDYRMGRANIAVCGGTPPALSYLYRFSLLLCV